MFIDGPWLEMQAPEERHVSRISSTFCLTGLRGDRKGLARFTPADAFGFALARELQAFHRFMAHLAPKPKGIVVHREDISGARIVGHFERLLGIAVGIDVWIVGAN